MFFFCFFDLAGRVCLLALCVLVSFIFIELKARFKFQLVIFDMLLFDCFFLSLTQIDLFTLRQDNNNLLLVCEKTNKKKTLNQKKNRLLITIAWLKNLLIKHYLVFYVKYSLGLEINEI